MWWRRKAVTIRHMKTEITLKYDGQALAEGQMDVYQTAANMIAFSEFMAVSVNAIYGKDAQTRAKVVGFRGGSFTTMLAIQVLGAAGAVFTELTPGQLWDVVKGTFLIWKHLKGEPAKSIENHGQMVNVENNSGQIIQTRIESLTLVMEPTAVSAVKKFVGDALGQADVSIMTIGSEGNHVATVEKSEAPYFVAVTRTEQVSDSTTRVVLNVVGPVFEGSNKWRFSDGDASFSAAIKDSDYLSRVDQGFERFGKGDILEVDLRVVQSRSGQKVTAEREVLKVYQHLKPQEPPALF